MNPPTNSYLQDSPASRNAIIDLSKKARQKLRSRRYEEAKSLFREGLEVDSENPYLLSGMGDACRESGDYREAERCYKELLKIDRRNLFALRGLGDVYKKLNRHQDAIKRWQAYLDLRPQDKHVMTRIADSFKVLQQFDEAEETYRKILTFAPRDRFALTGLADLQHRQGKDEEAINTYERVLSFDENEIHILTIVGKLCWRISDFERSERCFRRALAIDPKNPYALYGLGNCYRWARNYEKALEIWQEILKHSDGTQTLHTRMGDAYIKVGRHDDAEKSYLRSLTYGEDIYSLAGLVTLYSERGEWGSAKRYFAILMAEDSEISLRLELLIKRFIHFEQTAEMVELFRKLLDSDLPGEQLRRQLEYQVRQFS